MLLKLRKAEVGEASVDIVYSIQRQLNSFDLLLRKFDIPHARCAMRIGIDDETRVRLCNYIGKLLVRQMHFLGVKLHVRTIIGGALGYLQRIARANVIQMRNCVNRIILNHVDIRFRVTFNKPLRRTFKHFLPKYV